jgi:hypothetical protein
MTAEEKEKWENVRYRMRAEGFHYCFNGYSSWGDIEDPEFHRLRLAYLEAADALEDYVKRQADWHIDEDEE